MTYTTVLVLVVLSLLLQKRSFRKHQPVHTMMTSFQRLLVLSLALLSTGEALSPSTMDRRKLLATGLATLMPQVARASLLDDYGSDGGTNKVMATPKATVVPSDPPVAKRVEIDPTLRGSYYYPTAKKRYLPRIMKVSTEIPSAGLALDRQNWDTLDDFKLTAENAILPLQLYQSSLDGQGLSMSSGYAKQMKDDAKLYEGSYKKFVKAVQKRDVEVARQSLSDMEFAISDYRFQGRLGNELAEIPSVEDIRRMSMRRTTGNYNVY